MNVERALQEAIKKPERGFPKFKNSSEPNQSFTFLPQKGSVINYWDKLRKTYSNLWRSIYFLIFSSLVEPIVST